MNSHSKTPPQTRTTLLCSVLGIIHRGSSPASRPIQTPGWRVVTQLDHEYARSARENTGRIAATKRSCLVSVGLVEAARFMGGQLFASPRVKLNYYRARYFAGAAASLSIVWKLSSSSQNCSARVHLGFNTNGRCAVQGLVYAFGSSIVMSSTRWS